MVVAGAGLLENRRAPATTLEGWRSFISADPSELALLPAGQWEALGERDRRDYDEARIAHHAELVVVTTSAIAEITTEGQMLVLMNQREIGARRGLIVSGDAATGKTTSIKQLGRLHELRVRARFPAGADRIPVVYVTCPPKGSPRKLAMEFARFLGLPLRTRANVTDIADAVCQVLIDARTDLVLVDEIHNLNHGTPAGEDLSDHLKYFTEHLPATFIYAGIDVERCGVFTGTRGRQLAGRCELICTGAFPYRDEWTQLIAALEATLRLHRHEPGTLPAQAKYLHQRTGGMIGSLTHLIRGAAIRAILSGQEANHPPAAGHRAHRPRRRVRHPPHQQHPVTVNPARLARFADWARTLPPRPLPRTVTPVPGEYYLDYISRLADANHLELLELTEALDDPAAVILDPGRRRQHQQERLAAAAGQPLARIARLYWDDAGLYLRDPDGFRQLLRPACRRCTARHGITAPIACRLPPHQTVCRRHRLWTGPAARTHAAQLDAGQFPVILKAQRRHLAQLHHHRWQDVEATISAATHAIYQALRDGTWIPGQRQRLRQLAPGTWEQALAGVLSGRPGRPDDGPARSAVEIAIYPDVVWLAARSLREHSAPP